MLALRGGGEDSALSRSARRRLELLGVAPRDIQALASAGEVSRAVPIRSPSSGFVLHKNAVAGAGVRAGQDLYRLADLSTIWVEAQVYQRDAPWLRLGQGAEITLTSQPGTVLQGEVSWIQPTLDTASRTVQVRVELDNPDLALKPGMFATVHIQTRLGQDVLAVPSEAILHSGERELVFVAEGQGRFAARPVVTGLVADDHLTQVRSGLRAGEVVVTSGQFLLDSESQLQEAVQKLLALRADAAVGMDPPDGESGAQVGAHETEPVVGVSP